MTIEISEKTLERWESHRTYWRNAEEAHRRSAREIVKRIKEIRRVILERNYGIAEDMIRELLEDLPHDSGAQEFYELYDRKLAEVIA